MTSKNFIDLTGASGATYRFRLWPDGTPHLPMAGNYVFVAGNGESLKVVVAGLTNDLSKSRTQERKAASRGATRIYTRLNVSRTVRKAEHEDLVAHYKPPVVHVADT
ncbi:MAG: hypothetical protein ACJ798_11945 [Phenylobacterium sp.]